MIFFQKYTPTINSVTKISALNQMKYVSMANCDMFALQTGTFFGGFE